jgi:hypothetical protein
MKKLTIIIPTMWRSDALLEMLPKYDALEAVQEILLIDNAPDRTPELPELRKLTVMTQGGNIYVNPAWNWGVSCAATELVAIVNDDLAIGNTDLQQMVSAAIHGLEEFELIGMHEQNFTDASSMGVELIAVTGKRHGFGTFMFMRREAYVQVPDEIKIFRGDHIQVKHCRTAVLKGVYISTPMSVTVKSHPALLRVGNTDKHIYRNRYMHYDRGKGRRRWVVYTSVTGMYDVLSPRLIITPGWEYYALVDADYPFTIPEPWVRVNIAKTEDLSDALRQRQVKMLGPELLNADEHTTIIFIDGNMTLTGSLWQLLADSGHPQDGMTVTRHWRDDCVYAEAEFCELKGKDTPERLRAASAYLRSIGHPEHGGLYETGIMIRDWTPGVKAAMQAWWDMLLASGTHRDQLTFSAVPLRHPALPFAAMDRSVRNRYVRISNHRPQPKQGAERTGRAH